MTFSESSFPLQCENAEVNNTQLYHRVKKDTLMLHICATKTQISVTNFQNKTLH